MAIVIFVANIHGVCFLSILNRVSQSSLLWSTQCYVRPYLGITSQFKQDTSWIFILLPKQEKLIYY